ncbi:hypothetical protein HYW20_04535 [Candidatus Woesearchaeota archaeon]|nr:hypothetical protein [Candidatus Woesearchaeota archaeon]
MDLSKLNVKARIIRKLVRWQKWGGSHTENILKGLPKHLVGNKVVKEALKELEKDEWLVPAKKTGETHYSLNPNKSSEIYSNSMKNIVKILTINLFRNLY